MNQGVQDGEPSASTSTAHPETITVHVHDHRGASGRGGGKETTAKNGVLPHMSKYGLGIFLILCVTVIWVASSEWIQFIFGALHFDKPYFLTYFNTTGFALWNLGYLVKASWREVPWDDEGEAQPICVEDPAYDYLLAGGKKLSTPRPIAAGTAVVSGSGAASPNSMEGEALFYDRIANDATYRQWNATYDSCTDYSSESSAGTLGGAEETTTVVDGEILDEDGGPSPVCVRVHRIRQYSKKRIWRSAAVFCPFWFFANYLFNLSLSYTSVSSNTIMSAMGTVWTVIISRMFLQVPVGPWKLAGVLICVSGSTIVGLSSSSSNGSSMLGNAIALVSSLLYAVYTFILKWCLPDDDRYSMGMVFGAVGVINFSFLWVGFPVLHYLNIEPFSVPSVEQLWTLGVNALIGTNLSDVLWARSVILTSPVVATLGLSLTTPLSMVVDALLHGSYYPLTYVLGALCVLCGFIVANIR